MRSLTGGQSRKRSGRNTTHGHVGRGCESRVTPFVRGRSRATQAGRASFVQRSIDTLNILGVALAELDRLGHDRVRHEKDKVRKVLGRCGCRKETPLAKRRNV
jgi:hypothetical protein